MKRTWIILMAGLLAAGGAYSARYFGAKETACCDCHPAAAPELVWMRREYGLNDAQFQKVSELHAAYQPQCMEMCHRINEQNDRLRQLLGATNVVTAEIERSLVDAAQLRGECQAAMLRHFYEVSRAMPPGQGRRYLEWVQAQTIAPMQPAAVAPMSRP